MISDPDTEAVEIRQQHLPLPSPRTENGASRANLGVAEVKGPVRDLPCVCFRLLSSLVTIACRSREYAHDAPSSNLKLATT